MCTASFTSTHSSNSGVCQGSAHPPFAFTFAIDTPGCPDEPFPANSSIVTSV